MKSPKSPFLAAFMNFIFPGAGYVYVGLRWRFGVILIAASVLTLFVPRATEEQEVTGTVEELLAQTVENIQDPAVFMPLIIATMFALAFAYDGWRDANIYNEELSLVESDDE